MEWRVDIWHGRLAESLDKHQRVLACLASIAILLGLHQAFPVAQLAYDAAEYWYLSTPGVLGTIPSHRGHAFPLLLQPLHLLGGLTERPLIGDGRWG